MSGEQAEERTAREGRIDKQALGDSLLESLREDGYTEANIVYQQTIALLSECSRLASRVEELAKKWKAAAMADVPPSYADRDLHHKYLKLDNYASGQDDCADELLELLAGAHAEEKE